MKPGSVSPYEQPKKLPKCTYFSQTQKAPPLKGMAGFSNFGRVGGTVKPGVDKP